MKTRNNIKTLSKRLISLVFTILLSAIIMTSCETQKQKADLILTNGIVYTVDNEFAVHQAFAVADGRFIAIGTTDEILKSFEAEKTIDAGGKAVYPGFIDGHCHFFGFGENLVRYAELAGSKSFDEVIQRLKAHQEAHPGDWILGRGWDQNRWADKQFPDNRLLENHFPGKKIFLIRIDGHAFLASNAALEAAEIDAKTTIEGGEVQLLANGKPSGILIDIAGDAIKSLIPSLTLSEKKEALMAAQDACFAVGLSGVIDAGLPVDKIQLIDSLQQAGTLKMKINAMLDPDETTLAHFLPNGPYFSERLSITAVKLYADGALGSRGALLIEPYSDDPENSGLKLFSDEFYEGICKQAFDAGFQVNMHAIGDGGNRYVLELYSKFLPKENDRRWRIEHAQIVHPDDFKLFGEYNIIPSIQSTHATSDMLWVPTRVGAERTKTAYAQQQLLEQNGWLINGTDFPIESIDPLKTFYSAVIRKNEEGYPAGGFQMENALSREDALRSITIWAAKGSFEEAEKGSIEVGKAADFVVLDHDIMQANEQQLKEAKVVKLGVSGELVYQK